MIDVGQTQPISRKYLAYTNVDLLKRLAIYLNNLPADYKDFNMSMYNDDSPHVMYHSGHRCGSAACALGHLPYIEGAPQPSETVQWREYGFDAIWGSMKTRLIPVLYNYMFDHHWAKFDNTTHGAAKRIWAVATGQVDYYDIPLPSREGVQSYQHIEVGAE